MVEEEKMKVRVEIRLVHRYCWLLLSIDDQRRAIGEVVFGGQTNSDSDLSRRVNAEPIKLGDRLLRNAVLPFAQ